MKSKLKLFVLSFVLVYGIYTLSYVAFRKTHTELWERDQNLYVIFPKDKKWIYYFYRPLTWLDAALTDMQFHIGPHEQ